MNSMNFKRKLNKSQARNPFFEELKAKGLWNKFLSLVRTKRSELFQDVPGGKTRQITDKDLLDCIEIAFQFVPSVSTLRRDKLNKLLFMYPDFAKAYMAGQSDLLTLIKTSAIDRIEDNASPENIELGLKVLDTESRILARNQRSVDGVNINLNMTDQTQKTISDVYKAIESCNIEPDWNGPDEEEVEWEQKQQQE